VSELTLVNVHEPTVRRVFATRLKCCISLWKQSAVIIASDVLVIKKPLPVIR